MSIPRPRFARHALVAACAATTLLAVGSVPAAAQDVGAAAAAALRITAPATVTAYANSVNGRRVSYQTHVTGASGVAVTICTVASGTVFPLGRTRVTCTVHDGAGRGASVTFAIRVVVRGGRFWAPLNVDGLVQKGDQLHPYFRIYRADRSTPLSDAGARRLLAAHHVTLTFGVGGVPATTVPLSYDVIRHAFTATVQTYNWTPGADYVVRYRVLGADGSVIATRAVTLGVRLGA
jgi:hypothetical protein